MNGRDLIVYIMENHLENEKVFDNGRLLGFMTLEEAAVRFSVGVATILVWCEFGLIKYVKIGEVIFIPANEETPMLTTRIPGVANG